MKLHKFTIFVVALLMAATTVGLVARAVSPAPMQGTPPGTPRPNHERLAVFEGTWAKKDLPASETFRDTCAGSRKGGVT